MRCIEADCTFPRVRRGLRCKHCTHPDGSLRARLSDLACGHGCDLAKKLGMAPEGACHCLEAVAPQLQRLRLRQALRLLRDLSDDPARVDLRAELDASGCGPTCAIAHGRGDMVRSGPCSCFETLGWRERLRAERAVQLLWLIVEASNG